MLAGASGANQQVPRQHSTASATHDDDESARTVSVPNQSPKR
jgi:hypothetical protein